MIACNHVNRKRVWRHSSYSIYSLDICLDCSWERVVSIIKKEIEA
jgi:hypothetical protein